MATLSDALNVDISGYRVVDNTPRSAAQPDALEPKYNPMMRCPMPPSAVTPDSLRQFYTGGQVPQVRLLAPPTPTSSNNGGVVNNTTVITNSHSGGGGTTPVIKATSASLTTAPLAPNAKFVGSLTLVAKSFQILGLSTNSPCRIEIYGTALAQSLDLSRGLDVAPAPGTTQNLISDIVLDSSPFVWSFQNRIASNADSPQNSLVYVTVTNLDTLTDKITVTVGYVPLESA